MADKGTETIAAIATPPGRGGVGIVRISGPRAKDMAHAIGGRIPPPRYASLVHFRDADGVPIDQGMLLYFPAPHSFTGEDVLELHGHGGPLVMDLLLSRTVELGARLARPGEFSERAFLNGKLDLAQAEAIADLIDSETTTAARLAARTLDGEFSRRIAGVQQRLTQLRMYVEAAIDFPEEEIDFLGEKKVSEDLHSIIIAVEHILKAARVGRVMRDGMTLVIAGRPNAGKSSLMNALAGYGAAIVTEVAGTTRDVLRERIEIDGMPLHLVDTAGLRETEDVVERAGVARAWAELERADRVLWVFDGATDPRHEHFDPVHLPPGVPITFVRNKADLTGDPPGIKQTADGPVVTLSARDGLGIDILRQHLRHSVGYEQGTEGEFTARRRHVENIKQVLTHLRSGVHALQGQVAGEILAEELRLAQRALGGITGEFTAEDLLGKIFASFCIGK